MLKNCKFSRYPALTILEDQTLFHSIAMMSFKYEGVNQDGQLDVRMVVNASNEIASYAVLSLIL